MQMTLLDMTQNVLSSMSSDEVNSIGDTTESLQVATIIKNKYFDIINRVNLPEHNQLVQLQSSLDLTSPVQMFVPDNVAEIKWMKYFNSDTIGTEDSGSTLHDTNVDIIEDKNELADTSPPGYQYVNIVSVQQFIDMVNTFNPNDTNVFSFTFTNDVNDMPGQYTFYYKNDRQPTYCCILSNYNVIFDAYDATVDSTLQSAKTMCWARISPVFLMQDNFIPDLDEEQFTLLLNEAKAMAYFELKQTLHPKAELEIKRGWSSVQKNKSVANKPSYFDSLPDFGRRGFGFTSPVSYFKSRRWDASNG